jgi:diguanylate cyclase (GGDEF)-like protein/PAS domain S-box-containing protein
MAAVWRIALSPARPAVDKDAVLRGTEGRECARAALEAADIGVLAFRAVRTPAGIDWEFLDANEPVRSRWGIDGDDAPGRLLSCYLESDVRRIMTDVLNDALVSGERVQRDHEVCTPSGATSWRRVIAVPLEDDVVAAITYDIGELVTARAHASVLAQDTSDIVAVAGVDSGLSWVSPAVEHALGLRADQLIGRCAVDLVHPDDVPGVIERFLSTADDPAASPMVDLRLRHADGSYSWFKCTLANRVADPDVRGIVMRMHDIDAFRRSEEALRVTESRISGILATADDAIVTSEEDGTVLQFNKAAERIFRLSAEEIIGSRYTDFLPQAGEYRMWARKSYEAARTGVPIEIRTMRADGEEFEARVSMSMTEVDGRIVTTAIVRDITNEKEVARALEQRGLYDELTGLASRKLLIDRIDEAVRRARRRGTVVGVLLLDLDRFKNLNDSLGHDRGDALLVEVAARLRAGAGDGNTVARLSGDEFVVVCDEVRDIDEISDRASRVDEALRAPFVIDGEEVMFTASIGIAVWNGGNERADDLVRHADAAMYRAKDRGRGRIELFDEKMQTLVAARLDLESSLRRAIDRDELVAYYQPIVAFTSGRPTHLEALVRWQRPDSQLVAPDQFIGIAEETGLIHAIGAWMLQRAALDCAQWQQLAPGVGVSVNVSPRQFDSPTIVETVADVLRTSGLPPQLLALEITESVLVDDADEAVALLDQLKELGVRIALDDFGTGYSSLTYLHRLPIDELKIDRSFVGALEDESADLNLLQMMIQLGRAFDLNVVAEGIDTDRKLRRIQRLGCHLGQGFLFARPAPFDHVMQRFADSEVPRTTARWLPGEAGAVARP